MKKAKTLESFLLLILHLVYNQGQANLLSFMNTRQVGAQEQPAVGIGATNANGATGISERYGS
jgi:hypothetical protein